MAHSKHFEWRYLGTKNVKFHAGIKSAKLAIKIWYLWSPAWNLNPNSFIWSALNVSLVDFCRLTLRDSSGVKPPSIGMTLTLFFGMTSRIEMSWVVTKTLAQTSKFLMILADHTSSKTSKLFRYWFRNNLRRISLACSTVVTDVTWKEIQNKFNFSMYMKKTKNC